MQDFRKGDILSVKLMTGEEIIVRHLGEATLTNGESYGYAIEHPINLIPSGSGGAALAPYLMTGDQNQSCVLHFHAIVMITYAKDEIADKYREVTSSLVLPKSKIIMG